MEGRGESLAICASSVPGIAVMAQVMTRTWKEAVSNVQYSPFFFIYIYPHRCRETVEVVRDSSMEHEENLLTKAVKR